jgi:phage gpG-like protein
LGREAEEQTEKRIVSTKLDPEGRAWKPWTEAYHKYLKRKFPSASLLFREGGLRDSIEFQLQGDNAVLTGATAEYADYHRNAKKEERRRKFLGLHTNDINDLRDLIDVFMEKRTA